MSAVEVALSPVHESPFGFYRNRSESIVIYLAVAGSVIPMYVLESGSVKSVKLKIENCKGLLLKKQKLVYGDKNVSKRSCFGKDGYLLQPVIVNPNVKIPRVIWDILGYVDYSIRWLKKGTKVGEGALREVAAYTLDHPLSRPRGIKNEFESGFAGVPPTVMVKCLSSEFNHPQGYDGGVENIKVGSLQMFFENCGSCEDMGPRDFPVEEVHKISVFDIRTANADRHAGNILMNREEGGIALIPIDHGYCLPENFKDCTFDWLYWPQAREPYSQEVLDYINSLDAEQDIALLNSHGWDLSLECARTFRISTMLLKKGAAKGLSPFVIGQIMCRETVDKESMIEKIVQKAHDSIVREINEAVFLKTVSNFMDSELKNICF
ncbi:phosphatidylinositol 4-kinase gamma 2 [Tanacetum coccineum]